MAPRKVTDDAIHERADRLRGALGLRPAAGQLTCSGHSIAWYHSLPAPALATQDPDANLTTIVGLHAIGSGSREFAPLLQRPIPGTRVVLFDWPSHGRSPALNGSPLTVIAAAAILHAFLVDQRISRPVLIGCGFGAEVALHYATSTPGRILGLVLCQPSGLVTRRKLRPSSPRQKDQSAAARRQALRILGVERAYPQTQPSTGQSFPSYLPGLPESLSQLSCPTLLTLSRFHHEYRLKDYLKLLDSAWFAAPQHRITVFDGSFHPIWDEPERWVQAVSSLIQAQLPLDQHHHAWLLTAVDWPTRSMNLWRCVHPECHAEKVLAEGRNANDPSEIASQTKL